VATLGSRWLRTGLIERPDARPQTATRPRSVEADCWRREKISPGRRQPCATVHSGRGRPRGSRTMDFAHSDGWSGRRLEHHECQPGVPDRAGDLPATLGRKVDRAGPETAVRDLGEAGFGCPAVEPGAQWRCPGVQPPAWMVSWPVGLLATTPERPGASAHLTSGRYTPTTDSRRLCGDHPQWPRAARRGTQPQVPRRRSAVDRASA
jgi:hypothetical protein